MIFDDGLDEVGFHVNLFDDCNLQPSWASLSVFVVPVPLAFVAAVDATQPLGRGLWNRRGACSPTAARSNSLGAVRW